MLCPWPPPPRRLLCPLPFQPPFSPSPFPLPSSFALASPLPPRLPPSGKVLFALPPSLASAPPGKGAWTVPAGASAELLLASPGIGNVLLLAPGKVLLAPVLGDAFAVAAGVPPKALPIWGVAPCETCGPTGAGPGIGNVLLLLILKHCSLLVNFLGFSDLQGDLHARGRTLNARGYSLLESDWDHYHYNPRGLCSLRRSLRTSAKFGREGGSSVVWIGSADTRSVDSPASDLAHAQTSLMFSWSVLVLAISLEKRLAQVRGRTGS